jgi:hypothetical protein
MTQDEIVEMTRQAGGFDATPKFLETFSKLVAQHEREACAKVCDAFQARDVGMQPAECAGAIRARSKE